MDIILIMFIGIIVSGGGIWMATRPTLRRVGTLKYLGDASCPRQPETTAARDGIEVNVRRTLGNQLHGTSQHLRTSAIAVRVSPTMLRYPDMHVDSGETEDTASESAMPTLVVVVDSTKSSLMEAVDEIEDYKATPSMQYILLIATREARARLYFRDAAGMWTTQAIAGFEATVAMPLLGPELVFADIYSANN